MSTTPTLPTIDRARNQLLESLPRKEGMDDIVEMPYDPTIVPALVAMVSKGYLRAAFLLETQEQKALRQQFAKSVNEPEFWKVMANLAYHERFEDVSYNHSEYTVPFTGKNALELQLPFTKRDLQGHLPDTVTETVRWQANLLRDSYKNCPEAITSIFPSKTQGGLFSGRIHNDPQYSVTLHQTVTGERGMDFAEDPSVTRSNLMDGTANLNDIGVIATGTLTIFGPSFFHASSPQPQIAISTSVERQRERPNWELVYS